MERPASFRNYIIAFVLVLIFALLTFLRLHPATKSDSDTPYTDSVVASQHANASLSLVFNDEDRRTFTGPLFEHTTLFDALIASSRAGNFEFVYDRDDTGIIITAIDGLTPDPDSTCDTWCIYVNTVAIERDVLESFILENNDIIEISTHELY